jgi:hypothetical protein
MPAKQRFCGTWRLIHESLRSTYFLNECISGLASFEDRLCHTVSFEMAPKPVIQQSGHRVSCHRLFASPMPGSGHVAMHCYDRSLGTHRHQVIRGLFCFPFPQRSAQNVQKAAARGSGHKGRDRVKGRYIRVPESNSLATSNYRVMVLVLIS